jgi:hypothetical protein
MFAIANNGERGGWELPTAMDVGYKEVGSTAWEKLLVKRAGQNNERINACSLFKGGMVDRQLQGPKCPKD